MEMYNLEHVWLSVSTTDDRNNKYPFLFFWVLFCLGKGKMKHVHTKSKAFINRSMAPEILKAACSIGPLYFKDINSMNLFPYSANIKNLQILQQTPQTNTHARTYARALFSSVLAVECPDNTTSLPSHPFGRWVCYPNAKLGCIVLWIPITSKIHLIIRQYCLKLSYVGVADWMRWFWFVHCQAYEIEEKVRFTLSNYNKNLIFNLQVQNRITEDIQLTKPGKFGPEWFQRCLKK